ncbi:uncharacterized protein LOC144915447 isoform X3 [Branchiostoma floridae x Branchiostoma belcheri]
MRYGGPLTVLLTLLAAAAAQDCTAVFAESAGTTARLGGLFRVHDPGTGDEKCGDISLKTGEAVEAMLFAVDKLSRSNQNLVEGVTFDVQIYDTCGREDEAAKATLELVGFAEPENINFGYDATTCPARDRVFVGLVGPSLSQSAISASEILTPVQVPVISPTATSIELDDKERFPYFMRTASSDKSQAQAMVELLVVLGWTYVSTVASADSYGRMGIAEFTRAAKEAGICVAVSKEVSNTASGAAYFGPILNELIAKAGDGAVGVVAFLHDFNFQRIMDVAVSEGDRAKVLTWIVSEGVGPDQTAVQEYGSHARGMVTFRPAFSVIQEFQQHMESQHAVNRRGINPWFPEYYMELNQCKINHRSFDYTTRKYVRFANLPECDSLVMLSGFNQTFVASKTIDAVYAFAHALRAAQTDLCEPNPSGLCDELLEMTQEEFFRYLQDVYFTGLGGNTVRFDETGNVEAAYDLFNYADTDNDGEGDTFNRIGTYQGETLDVALMNITMYDQTGAEGIPDSACTRDCSRCLPLKEDKKYAHLSGDVLINGLFPVHAAGDTTFVCGDVNREKGIQTLEAFLYAIRRINQDANLLPSVSLGTLVLDTCYTPIQASQDVSNLQSRVVTYGVPNVDVYDIIGYVGALSSDVTVDVADVLTSLGIPQISWGSTSTLLSNADDYPFFLRTVPSDDLQGEAIAALVDYFGWNYVATVSSDTVYGRSGITAFRQAANNYDICVSFNHVVPRDATDEQLDAIITALRENTRARAVVSFVTDSDARALLQAATRLNARGELIWIGSDSWGSQASVVDGLENAARGALTITLENIPVAGFENYFKALTPDSNSDNPWFKEFWEDYFGCNLPGGTKYADNCSPSHSLTQGFQQASFVPQVMNAVYAFAHGLDALLREHCSGAQGVCSELKANENFKQLLLEKTKQQQFTGVDGQPVQFNDDGSVTMGFTIWNYVRVRSGVYEYKDVGSFEGGSLRLDRLSSAVWYERDGTERFLSDFGSECRDFKICPGCTSLRIPDFFASGDDNTVVVPALFPIHAVGETSFECGAMRDTTAVQYLEAFLYTLDIINRRSDLLASATLGTIILDTCSSSDKAASQVLKLHNNELSAGSSGDPANATNIMAYVGGKEDDITKAVAGVLSPLKITQVSYGSTGSIFNDRGVFPTLLRTVPSNEQQAVVMVALMKEFGWTYASVVYTPDAYGVSGKDLFVQTAQENSVCVATVIQIPDVRTNDAMDKIIEQLREKKGATAVAVFADSAATRSLLQAADRAATAGEFVWFGGTTWGTRQDVAQGLGFVSRGAFTLELKSDALAGFDTYFRTLRPSSNTRNPWFNEFWEETFACYLTEKDPSYPPRPSCTGAERLEDSWVHDTFVSYTATALFSIAHGLTRLATDVCGAATFCEGLLNHPDRQALTVQYVRNASFTEVGLSHLFTEQGAGQPNYVVMNYQRDGSNYHYTQVGTYSGDTLTLSRPDVRMYDSNGDVVTPTSKCIENCELCLTEAARVVESFLLVTEDVDVLVAGVFPVHEAGDGIFSCGEMSQAGFEMLEAFLFAIDRVNDDGTLLTNVKLGPFAIDSCSSSMRASRDVSNFYSRSVTFQNSLDPPARPNNVIGYIAEETDAVTTAVANQITPFKVVNVAYGASGVELGNTNTYPYVLRTVPSDLREANAVLSIVQRFGWSYVSVVLSDNTYGRTLSQEFARISKEAGVCIATTRTIGTTATAGDLALIVTALKTKLPGAVGLVLFTSAEDTRRLLEALTASADATGAFILVTGTKWGDLLSVARGFEVAARGAITLTIPDSQVPDWQTYFENLQPGSYFRNPWFNEFWNDHFQCDFSNTQDRKYDSTCLGTERFNFGANSLDQHLYVPYVIDAVYGIANGLHSLLVSTCGASTLCPQFNMSNVGNLLRDELTKIRFAGANARQFGFTEMGDGNVRYNVQNFQRRVDGSYGFVEVGSYTSAALDLNVNNVRVYNRPGQVLTQIPRSACNGTCFECLDESFPNRCTNGSATAGSAAVVDGDIFVAGLFPIHDRGHDVFSCGSINQWEMQLFEAYMFALDRINADPSILPSVRLGTLTMDTCESGRKASRDIANFLSGEKTYYVTEYSSSFVEPASTLAVIGASEGDVSLNAMEVVETFKMAQVSYASPEIPMATRTNYEYLFRTLPALERQVQALMDMAAYFKWNYVSVLYTPTVYGTVLYESFKEEAKTRGVCLAVQQLIRNNFTHTNYDDVIVELRRKGEASTVILFTERTETENILLAAQRVNVRSFYTWIVTSKVAGDVDVPLAQDSVINGAVLLKVETEQVAEFDRYLETLTPESNERNPWFKEFWQEHFQCNLPNEPVKYPVVCSGNERLTESSLTRNPEVVHVIRAVYAVAHGLDTTRKFYCPTEPEVCDNFRNANDKPERAYGFIRDVDLIGIAGSRFRFTTTRDGDVGYEILNYEITAPPSRYGYVKIGTWSDGLFLERSPQSTSTENVKYPASQCTGDCTECVQQGILPVPPQERRIDIPTEVRTRDVWAIICMTLAALGMFLTLMLMIYFLVKVRSSSLSGVTTSTSLGYVILLGLFSMYAMVLPFVMTPNDVVCGVRRFGLGFFYALTHGAILVKTIRIWRMSRMEKAGFPGEEAKFTRNWSNVFIVSALMLPQIGIGVCWLLASPPATYSLGTTIYCGYSRAGLLLSLLYVMFLVFLTVIYSFVARNYSMNMWEARYIIAMVWLCVCVWISWACVFMLTDREFWDPAVCVGLLLIATFILILLFVPKLQAFATTYRHNFTSRYDINKRPNSIQRSDVETDSLGSLDSMYGGASLQDSAVTADAFYRSKTANGKLSRSVSNTSNHAGASNLYVYDGRRERQNDLEITNIDNIVDEENESKEESYGYSFGKEHDAWDIFQSERRR